MFLITGLFRPASPNRSLVESVPNLIHHLVDLSVSSGFLLPEQRKLLT